MTALRHDRAAYWQQASEIRDEWSYLGRACTPADQPAAESALTQLYARLGRPRPRFAWVASPREAQPLVSDLPTLDDLYRWIVSPPRDGVPPLASDLAAAVARLRGALDDQIPSPARFDPPPPRRKKGEKLPRMNAEQALAYGLPFAEIVRQHVRQALFDELAHGFYLPARRALGPDRPVCWYGQQEAHWIAYYDVWRRLGLAGYGTVLDADLDVWQVIARSAGWFWPGEDVCVVSERPVSPGVFADGWTVQLR
ncbi:hypothetical protein [Longispora albida]|uniref:hypothetical protein n=1 Tax=Longispora albida TaxID=203523 RepID=UPI00037EB84A|nr:hypothetical protein [Longispora albida]